MVKIHVCVKHVTVACLRGSATLIPAVSPAGHKPESTQIKPVARSCEQWQPPISTQKHLSPQVETQLNHKQDRMSASHSWAALFIYDLNKWPVQADEQPAQPDRMTNRFPRSPPAPPPLNEQPPRRHACKSLCIPQHSSLHALEHHPRNHLYIQPRGALPAGCTACSPHSTLGGTAQHKQNKSIGLFTGWPRSAVAVELHNPTTAGQPRRRQCGHGTH